MQFKRGTSGRGLMRAAKHLIDRTAAGILGLALATALLAQGQRGYNQIYNFGAAVAPTSLTGTGAPCTGRPKAAAAKAWDSCTLSRCPKHMEDLGPIQR